MTVPPCVSCKEAVADIAGDVMTMAEKMPAWVKSMCSRLGRDPCDVVPADQAAAMLVGPARMLFPAPAGQPVAVDFACPFAGEHEDGRLVLLWGAKPDGPSCAAESDVREAADAYGSDGALPNMGLGVTRGGRVHGVLMIPQPYKDSRSGTHALRHVHGYLASDGNREWDKSKGMTWMLRQPMPLSGQDALASGGQLVSAGDNTFGVSNSIPSSEVKQWSDADKRARTVIVYCAGPTCPMGWRMAHELAGLGFMRVYVVPAGAPALNPVSQSLVMRGGKRFRQLMQ